MNESRLVRPIKTRFLGKWYVPTSDPVDKFGVGRTLLFGYNIDDMMALRKLLELFFK